MFPWYKVYAGMTSDPKFKVVARQAGRQLSEVLAVWIHLMDYANAAEVRGSLPNLDGDILEAELELPPNAGWAILSALYDQGMINDSGITNWEKRQSVPNSSTLRCRAWRAKKKAEQMTDQNNVYPQHVGTQAQLIQLQNQLCALQKQIQQLANATGATPNATGATPNATGATPNATGATPVSRYIDRYKDINKIERKEETNSSELYAPYPAYGFESVTYADLEREAQRQAARDQTAQIQPEIADDQDQTPQTPQIRQTDAHSQTRQTAQIRQTDAPESAFITLPLNQGVFAVDRAYVKILQDRYPAVNVPQQLKNMEGWLESSPKKRKTLKGIRKFINNWLCRHQDASPRINCPTQPDPDNSASITAAILRSKDQQEKLSRQCQPAVRKHPELPGLMAKSLSGDMQARSILQTLLANMPTPNTMEGKINA